MPVDDDPSLSVDVSTLTEITHETMMERWRLGLVTPMSASSCTCLALAGPSCHSRRSISSSEAVGLGGEAGADMDLE